MLNKLLHRLFGIFHVEVIVDDFNKIVAKLEAAVQFHAQVAQEQVQIATKAAAAAATANAAADKAQAVADKVRALVN